ncbi:MAG: phasin family protein [Pseudomonadota bacterium]|nr:phasin family protein [Pseudomonadota bacterium]
MAEDKASSMGKVGQAAGKSEEVARGMSKSSGSSQGGSSASSMPQGASSFGMPGMPDFSKMFEGARMPGMVDMDTMLAAYRRNMEALSTANRVALEGAQQVARRHMEIMQQTMGEMTEAMRSLTSAESPQDRAGKQAEMLKGAYDRAVTNMRDLADLIQRSNGEALNVLNQRFTEAIDEAKTMMEKTRPS